MFALARCLFVHFVVLSEWCFHVSSVFYVHTSALACARMCMLVCTCTSHFIDIDACMVSANYTLPNDREAPSIGVDR